MSAKFLMKVVAKLPVREEQRWEPRAQLIWAGSTLAYTYATIGAFQKRIELVEEAFGEVLWSRSIRLVQLCTSLGCLLGVLWWATIALLVELNLWTWYELFEFKSSKFMLSIRLANDLILCTAALAVVVLTARSLGTVSKSVRAPSASSVSKFVLAETEWASKVIRRALIGSMVLPGLVVTQASVDAIITMASLLESRQHDTSSINQRHDLWALGSIYFVDFASWLVVLGFFQPVLPEIRVKSGDLLPCENESSGEQSSAWRSKVRELAERSIDVGSLLEFHSLLGTPQVMPHYDPRRHTTNDVVRGAIVPLSRRGDRGQAYTAFLTPSSAVTMPSRMVTHDWQNIFVHLVAAVVADALDLNEYHDIAKMLTHGMHADLRLRLEEARAMQQRYWICAFCVNQHTSICGSFGNPPPQGSVAYERWDANRRDTVTGAIHPLCCCSEPKSFNDAPDSSCELDKFHDMMALLASKVVDFQQVLAVDRNFNVFSRLWCVAELVQAYVSYIPQRVILLSEKVLDVDNADLSLYSKLVNLSVFECHATRAEDKEAILAKIPDVYEFDAQIHALIFSERGLLANRLVGTDILRAAAKSARRVSVALKAALAKASTEDGAGT